MNRLLVTEEVCGREPIGHATGTQPETGFLTVPTMGGTHGLTCGGAWAPRARLERATYCLGGTTAPAPCTPAKPHVTDERKRDRQSFSERSSNIGIRLAGHRQAADPDPVVAHHHDGTNS